MIAFTPTPLLDALLDLTLAEDIGTGDVTSALLIPAEADAAFALRAREPLVVCGAPVVDRLFWRFGPGAPSVDWHVAEGARVEPGDTIGVMRGNQRSLLVLERPALNFLQRLSGIATLTRRYVEAVEGTGARVVDTRKTLPGWRVVDKYAVRVGGGTNHRAALDGGILIKDNHLQAAGGVEAAVRRARAEGPHSLRVEVEVEDLPGLRAAVEAGADVILLDNFSPKQVQAAVQLAKGRALLEASGGITLETIRHFAEAGVELIAVGALTHSARAVDIGADVLAG
ncbi:MAG: carboxylating nicotinate-nucleotide diphosphorylase [Myxococcales bacterium]|nr:carboxylating nicotinate-nucleotide diphosphorylase [Myxococcales bacterium]MCB9544469.1 carboxylating nicotinate-nucleotide diphosphorylase [Myxococcales bacterium]